MYNFVGEHTLPFYLFNYEKLNKLFIFFFLGKTTITSICRKQKKKIPKAGFSFFFFMKNLISTLQKYL